MLASSPPSTDVKPDLVLPNAPGVGQQQQHLTDPTAAPRRTSYSLYYHNNHEPEVYPEFNWEEHSSAQLPRMSDRPLSESGALESKLDDAPLPLPVESYQGTASASPPSSRSETFNSEGGPANPEVSIGRQASPDDGRAGEPARGSGKRPRPPSLSQLDSRCFERYRHPHVTSSHSSPASVGGAAVKLRKENGDVGSLPPIVTRDEIPPEASSTLLQSSAERAPFPVEDYASHRTPVTPHSATSISFSSHQSQSQQLHYSSHPTGYLSAVPSPAPHCTVNGRPGDRAAYPGSPIMALTGSNAATFPPESNSSFSPLTSQLQSAASVAHHLPSPASAHFRPSDTAFSRAATPRLAAAYHGGGATQDLDPAVAPGTHPAVSPAPPPTQGSPWSSAETPAPRRRGKLPSAVTTILKGWLMAHTTHPYPTEEEKKNLCHETNLTMNQVSNWFINARRRILVPPSAGNSVHEVRQPVRRQTHSQLVRAAGNAGGGPPCLTIRHVGPQPHSASPSPGISMFSPVSAPSPHLPSAAGSFDFRYPITNQPAHENPYQSEGLSASRQAGALSPCSSQWPNSTQLLRQTPSSPLYPSHHGALSYYSSSHAFQGYPPSHSSSSTPLPSPHYTSSFPGGPPHYPPPQARLHSPRPNPNSHPSTPTLSHSSSQHHSTPAYTSQAPCNPPVSFPTNQDEEN